MTYTPGQFLSDSEIAAELNLSRTPVLYALRYLECEGLVNRQHRQGWQICALSLDDIHDIFNIKVALGVMLARQAAGCQDETLRHALRDAVTGMIAANEADDLEMWEIAHRQWHNALMAMSEYPEGRVGRILDNLNDQWRRVRNGLLAIEGRMARETLEHEAVAEAILSGDGAAAEERMRKHLQSVRHDLVNLLTHIVLPFATQGL
jgi:DNA-binding GntR family transcriptional regulator